MNMQLMMVLDIGDRQYSVSVERDAELMLHSEGPLSCESALVDATDELRRKLAVKIAGCRSDTQQVNMFGLGSK